MSPQESIIEAIKDYLPQFDFQRVNIEESGWTKIFFSKLFEKKPTVLAVAEAQKRWFSPKKLVAPISKIDIPQIAIDIPDFDVDITPMEIVIPKIDVDIPPISILPTTISIDIPPIDIPSPEPIKLTLPKIDISLAEIKGIVELLPEKIISGIDQVVTDYVVPILQYLGFKLPIIYPWSNVHYAPCNNLGDPLSAWTKTTTVYPPSLSLRVDSTRRMFNNEFEKQILSMDSTIIVPQDNMTIRFATRSDDGSRVYVDGNLVIDNWGTHGPRGYGEYYTFDKAGTYPMTLAYYNAADSGMCDFWTEPGLIPHFEEIDLDELLETSMIRFLEASWDMMWDAAYWAIKNIPSWAFGILGGYNLVSRGGWFDKKIDYGVGSVTIKIPPFDIAIPDFSPPFRYVIENVFQYVKLGVNTADIVVKPIFRLIGHLIARAIGYVARLLYKTSTGWIKDQIDKIDDTIQQLVIDIQNFGKGIKNDIETKIEGIRNQINVSLGQLEGNIKASYEAISGYINRELPQFKNSVNDSLITIQSSTQAAFNDLTSDVSEFGIPKQINKILADMATKLTSSLTTAFAINSTNTESELTTSMNAFGQETSREVNNAFTTTIANTQDQINLTLNETITSIKDRINNALAQMVNSIKTQIREGININSKSIEDQINNALNATFGTAEEQINAGFNRLTEFSEVAFNTFIPELYKMVGLPTGYSLSQVLLKDISEDGFYVWSTGKMQLQYVAFAPPKKGF